MKTRNWLILLGILIAIPVGWYLISPLFINKTVSEEFPTAQATEMMAEAPQDPVPDTVGIELDGSLDLGELKGNIGDQNYEIPADLDLSQFKSVVVWCQPFRVPFNAAPLRTQ